MGFLKYTTSRKTFCKGAQKVCFLPFSVPVGIAYSARLMQKKLLYKLIWLINPPKDVTTSTMAMLFALEWKITSKILVDAPIYLVVTLLRVNVHGWLKARNDT